MIPTQIRIGGVPEHFNFPWHMCIENSEFNEAGIDLQWTNVPEGTGKMCQMLRDNETDIAIILTEYDVPGTNFDVLIGLTIFFAVGIVVVQLDPAFVEYA